MTYEPERWALDGALVVLPSTSSTSPEGDRARFRVGSPSALGEVEGSAYQIQLLRAFYGGESPEALLERYPFERDASHRFLLECRDAGLLRPALPDGRPEPPDRVRVDRRFVGAPAFCPRRPASFTVLGIPFDGNTSGHPGARFGPAAVRATTEGIRYALDPTTQVAFGFVDHGSGRHLLGGVTLADAGDVYVSPGEDGPELYARVTDVVRDLLDAGTVPLVIGGDHSLTAPVLSAFPPEPLQVVHLDAHTDLGEVERSDGTGLHHGNVFSVALAELPHLVHLRQIGLRGIIEAAAYAEAPRARQVGIDELRERGPGYALEGLDPSTSTYVSIDIDVVDPSFAPSTGTPVPGGLFPHELKALLRALGARARIVGVDVMEVARPVGPADGTPSIAAEILLVLADAISERVLGELERARAAHPGEKP